MLGNAEVAATLAVTDIDRAKEFYSKKLGLNEVRGVKVEESSAVFRAGNSTLYLYERPTPAGSTATVCSFQVDDVVQNVRNLQKNGIRFEEYDLPDMGIKTKNGIATIGEHQTAWFKDPDGNILAVGNAIRSAVNPARKTPVAKTV